MTECPLCWLQLIPRLRHESKQWNTNYKDTTDILFILSNNLAYITKEFHQLKYTILTLYILYYEKEISMSRLLWTTVMTVNSSLLSSSSLVVTTKEFNYYYPQIEVIFRNFTSNLLKERREFFVCSEHRL